jgi:Nif-specific regulatory protein
MCFSFIMWQQHSKHPIHPIVNAAAPVAQAPEIPRESAAPATPAEPVYPVGESGDPQKQQLLDALERCGWVQAKAARLLGITPRQIGYAILKHGIEVKRY